MSFKNPERLREKLLQDNVMADWHLLDKREGLARIHIARHWAARNAMYIFLREMSEMSVEELGVPFTFYPRNMEKMPTDVALSAAWIINNEARTLMMNAPESEMEKFRSDEWEFVLINLARPYLALLHVGATMSKGERLQSAKSALASEDDLPLKDQADLVCKIYCLSDRAMMWVGKAVKKLLKDLYDYSEDDEARS